VGLHAWDHHAWQTWCGVWDSDELLHHIALGKEELESIIGTDITCSAVAGWRADQRVIKAKEAFDFRYNSDCRGSTPFYP
jgi:undecaprenyl phosphate-alpha-L-ara4FN deformylase